MRRSALLTGLSALALAGFLGVFGHAWLTEPRLARVANPERALALIVGQTLDVDWALEHASAWERRLYQITLTESARDLAQAIDWYAELAAVSPDPGVRVRLAILEAEAGGLDRARRSIAEWRAAGQLEAAAALLEAAYLAPAPPRAPSGALREMLERRLEPGWFRDRLAQRLAVRAGDRPWLAEIAARARARTAPLLLTTRALLALQLGLVAAGALAVLALVRRRRRRWLGARVADAVVPAPWRVGQGLHVVIRGAGAGVVVTLGLLFTGRGPWLEVAAVLLPALPLVWLAHRLARSEATTLTHALGLVPARGGWAPLALWTAALVAAGLLVDVLLALGCDASGLAAHWTEWFDPDLAWGRASVATASVVGAVVAAPVVEELGFRGLLYGTLRVRLGLPVAAAASALIFAALHGYGVVGFLSVFTSGMLWAWAFERSGSVLPGIAAHAVNNLSASVAVLVLLRV
ncbi:MAG: lysostaphin resistance A-like protein [Candidatus Rokuibacteriota bacterium]